MEGHRWRKLITLGATTHSVLCLPYSWRPAVQLIRLEEKWVLWFSRGQYQQSWQQRCAKHPEDAWDEASREMSVHLSSTFVFVNCHIPLPNCIWRRLHTLLFNRGLLNANGDRSAQLYRFLQPPVFSQTCTAAGPHALENTSPIWLLQSGCCMHCSNCSGPWFPGAVWLLTSLK